MAITDNRAGWLATQLFPGRDAIALAPALYTFGCMLTGTMLARWWAGREVSRPGVEAEVDEEPQPT